MHRPFTLGLFITIAVVGIVCALLGRMLGDVGIWWQILVGAVLIWVALGMLGVQACSMSGASALPVEIKRGIHGAFGLGLAYGILSGSCTFGFIAPILAIVTVQQKIVAGFVYDYPLRLGPLPTHRRGRQFQAAVRKLTENTPGRGRFLVQTGCRNCYRTFGCVFYHGSVNIILTILFILKWWGYAAKVKNE